MEVYTCLWQSFEFVCYWGSSLGGGCWGLLRVQRGLNIFKREIAAFQLWCVSMCVSLEDEEVYYRLCAGSMYEMTGTDA